MSILNLNRDVLNDYNLDYDPIGLRNVSLPDSFMTQAFAPEVDDIEAMIEARKNREELDRRGLMALDDAGLNTAAMIDEFSQTSKPRFDVRNFLTNVKDKGVDMFGSGKDLLLRGIGSYVGGPVGSLIGSLIGGIKESPTDKVGLASFGGDYDPYGFKGQLTSGTLGTRQDPFGRNIVSAFGDYYGNRLAEVAKLSKLQNLNKFQKAKLDFGKKYLEKVKEERAKESAAASAALEAQRRGRRPGTGGDGPGVKDSGGIGGGYSYDSGGREGFGYGL